MRLRSESDVVRDVPTVVIRVFVNHDRVVIPEPVVNELVFVRRYVEEVPVEPETLRASSLEAEDVAGAKACREVPQFQMSGSRGSELHPGSLTATVSPRCGRLGLSTSQEPRPFDQIG